jgi:hypothetical protein
MRTEWALKSLFMAQNHRLPAPRVRASDAIATRAQVKRARFAFTDQHLEHKSFDLTPAAELSVRGGGWPRQISGFASLPRDRFALDGMTVGTRVSRSMANVEPRRDPNNGTPVPGPMRHSSQLPECTAIRGTRDRVFRSGPSGERRPATHSGQVPRVSAGRATGCSGRSLGSASRTTVCSGRVPRVSVTQRSLVQVADRRSPACRRPASRRLGAGVRRRDA